MKQKIVLILLVLLIGGLAACGGAGSPADVEPPMTDEPDDPPIEIVDEMISGEAMVESIQINIMESFPLQASVDITGFLGDGCTELDEISVTRNEETFMVLVTTKRPSLAVCTQQLVGFQETVTLDILGLPAGDYTVNVNGVTDTFNLPMDNVSPDAEMEETDAEAELAAADWEALVELTLARALVAQEIPDYALLAEQKVIIVSSENLDGVDLPEIEGHTLQVMTPDMIQAQADAEGDFPYLRFLERTAVSADAARLSLGSTWAIGAESDMLYLSGGGFTIEYSRTTDGWQGEITESWIS